MYNGLFSIKNSRKFENFYLNIFYVQDLIDIN